MTEKQSEEYIKEEKKLHFKSTPEKPPRKEKKYSPLSYAIKEDLIRQQEQSKRSQAELFKESEESVNVKKLLEELRKGRKVRVKKPIKKRSYLIK